MTADELEEATAASAGADSASITASESTNRTRGRPRHFDKLLTIGKGAEKKQRRE